MANFCPLLINYNFGKWSWTDVDMTWKKCLFLLMPNSHKKSWTVSNFYTGRTGNTFFMMSFYVIWPLKYKSFLIISSNFLRIKSLKRLMQPLNFDETKLFICILQILHKYPHFFLYFRRCLLSTEHLLSCFWYFESKCQKLY